jgi:hypothetical protein
MDIDKPSPMRRVTKIAPVAIFATPVNIGKSVRIARRWFADLTRHLTRDLTATTGKALLVAKQA